MLKSLQRYLLGALRVSIRGSGCERFLNLVHGEKFKIFDVCRDDDGCVTFGIDRKNFRRLRPLVRKSHVKIHIQKSSDFRSERAITVIVSVLYWA